MVRIGIEMLDEQSDGRTVRGVEPSEDAASIVAISDWNACRSPGTHNVIDGFCTVSVMCASGRYLTLRAVVDEGLRGLAIGKGAFGE